MSALQTTREPNEWDAWFAWLPRISPINDQRKPLADHECGKCGQLDCDCGREPCSK